MIYYLYAIVHKMFFAVVAIDICDITDNATYCETN